MSTPSSSQMARSRASLRGYCAKSAASLNWRGLTKIVTTVVASSARARRISERWPSWSQPMVGHEAHRTGRAGERGAQLGAGAQDAGHAATSRSLRRRRSASEVAVERDPRDRRRRAGRSSAPRARARRRAPRRPCARSRLGPGNVPAGDVGGVGARPRSRIVSRRCAYGRAWRGMNVAEAEQVRDDLDLAGAAGAGADADRRDRAAAR